MPTWISDEKAVLHPAKERVALKNLTDKPMIKEMVDIDGKKFKVTVPPQGDYIYEGPDRAALFQWWEENGKPSAEQMTEMEGGVTFGSDFKNNEAFLEQYAKAKNTHGFNKIEEYLTYLGYDSKKLKDRFDANASRINVHDLPDRIQEIKKLGGGVNTARGSREENRYGGFGEIPDK